MLIYMHLQYLCFLFDCPVDIDVLHLQYFCFFDCPVDVEVCIYSTSAFLIVLLMLRYAFTVLMFSF